MIRKIFFGDAHSQPARTVTLTTTTSSTKSHPIDCDPRNDRMKRLPPWALAAEFVQKQKL